MPYSPDPNNPGWLLLDGSDPAQESNWWKLPDGYVADPANPGWYFLEGSDVAQQSNWVHDPSIEDAHGADAFAVWDAAEIARLTQCNQANIESHWPTVYAALVGADQASVRSQAGMIGTIAIETASKFWPVSELYNDPPGKYAYFEGMYGIGHHPSAAAMGNTTVGDGARYYGRGDIQITWKSNYKRYGDRIGIDLVDNPDAALDPTNAAKIAALFWLDHNCQASADEEDWTTVRKKVQGGSAGLARLQQIAGALVLSAKQRGLA